MSRWLALAISFALLAGCFRLSDPIYVFKSLRADEPASAESSLLLVTIEGSFFDDFDTIYFNQIDPDVGKQVVYTTKEFIFRVFAPRTVKDGHFLITLPPGVYELAALDSRSVWRDVRYTSKKEVRKASRIYVTRPGVYDLGTLKLDQKSFFSSYTIESAGDAWSSSRRKLLKSAIAGTSWESLYAEQVAR